MSDVYAPADDEISLRDIAVKLWRRRGLIVVLPIITALMGFGVVLLTAVSAKTPLVHYISLTAIENGNYPNGVLYSVNDIVSPEVLDEVARRMGLENDQKFADAIMVSNSSPVTEGVVRKYADRLANQKLSSPEIDAINTALELELRETSQRGARISVDFKALNITAEQAEEIAILLPQIWQKIFTERFQILDNTKLQNVTQRDDISLASTRAVLEANNYVLQMQNSLNLLSNDSRLRSLQLDNGVTPSDLARAVASFEQLYLGAILSRNLNNDDDLTAFYQDDLRLQILQSDEQIAGLDDAIESVQVIISGGQPILGNSSNFAGDRMQIDGTAIENIIELVNTSSLSDYLTALYDKKIALINQRSDLNRQQNKIQTDVKFTADFMLSAEQNLTDLNRDYVTLLRKARNMNRANIGSLHQSLGKPYVIGGTIPKNSILIIILAGLIGGILAMVMALIMPYSKQDEAR